jgi:hypothetical protein
MSRRAALAAALLLALAPSRAVADIMTDGQEPPRPQSVPTGRYGFGVSMVLRFPSGPGFDLSYRPLKRLEIGGEISSWLAVSEAGVYFRGAIVTEEGNSVTLGARLHSIAMFSGDEGMLTSKRASVEVGFTHLEGSTFWGVELAKAVWIDGAWANDQTIGITAEWRYGAVW